MEFIDLEIGGDGDGLEAKTIEVDGVWFVIVSLVWEDRFVLVLEASKRPTKFTIGCSVGANHLAKLSVAFGEPLDEWEEDFKSVVGYQRTFFESFAGSDMDSSLRVTPLDEMHSWKAQMETVTVGEYLRSKITGVDPLAARN